MTGHFITSGDQRDAENSAAPVQAVRHLATQAATFAELIAATIDAVSELAGVDAAGWIERRGNRLSVRAHPRTPRSWSTAPSMSSRDRSLIADAMRIAHPSVCTDLRTERLPLGIPGSFASAVIAPATVEGRVVGGILVASRTPHAFAAGDIARLAETAEVLGEFRVALRTTTLPKAQLHFAFAQEALGLWAWNPLTGAFWMAPETEQMHGLAPGTFGGTVGDLTTLAARAGIADERIVRNGLAPMATPQALQYRIATADGRTRTLALRGQPQHADRPDSEWIGVAIDISDRFDRDAAFRLAVAHASDAREQAEYAATFAQESLDRLNDIIQEAPVAFALLDTQLRVLLTNTNFASLATPPLDTALGQPLHRWAPTVADRLTPGLETVLNSGAAIEHLEISGVPDARTGTARTWTTALFPTRSGDVITGVGITALDITEQKRAERTERLFREFSELFSNADYDAETALRQACTLPLPAFADFCAIAVRWPGTSEPVGHFARLQPPSPMAVSEVLSPGCIATLMQAVQTAPGSLSAARRITSNDLHTCSGFQRFDLHDALAVPIVLNGEVFGALLVGSHAPRRFLASDRTIIEELGFRCTARLAVEQHRLSTERTASRLKLLADLGKLASQAIISNESLDAITHALSPIYADVAVVIMRKDGRFTPVAGTAADRRINEWLSAYRSGTATGDASATARALASGTVQYFTRAEVLRRPEDYTPAVQDLFERVEIGAALVIPLYSSEGPLGSLFCGLLEDGRVFTPEDLAIAPEIGRQIAPIIETMERLQRARSHTATLQRSLLPSELPEHFGIQLAAQYLPAESELAVGGDWYDVIELADGALLLAIGDVVGHGAAAAGLTGQLRTALRIGTTDRRTVAELLGMLDRYIAGLGNADVATTLLVRIDRNANTMEWASAGHPPPLLHRRDGTVEFAVGPAGPPLGALMHPTFPGHHEQLRPGDSLLLYTDGLVERRDEDIDTGLQRLAIAAATVASVDRNPSAALRTIIDETLVGSEPRDDLAALIAHIDPTLRATVLRIPAELSELHTARQAIDEFLETGAVPASHRNDVLLVASELCTNAIEHGAHDTCAELVIACAHRKSGIELSVTNPGSWAVNTPIVGGRGLQIVRTVAQQLEIVPTPDGVRVTARFGRVATPVGA